MMYAVHCDLLVLGIGKTEDEALADALAHGAEDDGELSFDRILDDAARYVERGGDCRGLTLCKDGVFRLNWDKNGLAVHHE